MIQQRQEIMTFVVSLFLPFSCSRSNLIITLSSTLFLLDTRNMPKQNFNKTFTITHYSTNPISSSFIQLDFKTCTLFESIPHSLNLTYHFDTFNIIELNSLNKFKNSTFHFWWKKKDCVALTNSKKIPNWKKEQSQKFYW